MARRTRHSGLQRDVHGQVVGDVKPVDDALFCAIPQHLTSIHEDVVYSRRSSEPTRFEPRICSDVVSAAFLGSIMRILKSARIEHIERR